MFATKIIQREFLVGYLVHGGARVSNCTNFVRVELLPPVQRSRNIKVNGNHPHKFTMICTRIAKPIHEVEIVFADKAAITMTVNIFTRTITAASIIWISDKLAITLIPRIHRITHASDGRFPTHNVNVFNFQHFRSPYLH